MGKRKKVAVQKARGARPLVTQRLEGISKDVFKKYYPLITELIGTHPGVYALYDAGELYYVGRSLDLHRRVKHHLKDRHLASWTHFSLYLVRREEHTHEIESLLVRIANPKGNRVVPRGRSSGPLVKALRRQIKQRQDEELRGLFSDFRQRKLKEKGGADNEKSSLVGLVTRRTPLFREYKGKDYVGALSPKGIITLRGKKYTSPSGAARSVIQHRGAVNGWWFWSIRDETGNWVKLKDLRK
jgi:hypothetical protein